jgi:hypothetical protein
MTHDTTVGRMGTRNRRDNLIRAGALIVAEIERLDRAGILE